MSKSLGNVLLVHDLIETAPGEVIRRLALLSAHYRQPLDWSDETHRGGASDARPALRRVARRRGDEARAAAEPPETLIAALEDDLNTPKAMAEFFGLARELNKAKTRQSGSDWRRAMYAGRRPDGLLQ